MTRWEEKRDGICGFPCILSRFSFHIDVYLVCVCGRVNLWFAPSTTRKCAPAWIYIYDIYDIYVWNKTKLIIMADLHTHKEAYYIDLFSIRSGHWTRIYFFGKENILIIIIIIIYLCVIYVENWFVSCFNISIIIHLWWLKRCNIDTTIHISQTMCWKFEWSPTKRTNGEKRED